MKNFDDDEVEPGTGVGPANLSLPNEHTKCDPQLRSGLASSSQETNFSETLIPSLSAGQGRIFFPRSNVQLVCSFRDSLMGPRQLVARSKGKKNYRRETSGNDTLLILACMLL